MVFWAMTPCSDVVVIIHHIITHTHITHYNAENRPMNLHRRKCLKVKQETISWSVKLANGSSRTTLQHEAVSQSVSQSVSHFDGLLYGHLIGWSFRSFSSSKSIS